MHSPSKPFLSADDRPIRWRWAEQRRCGTPGDRWLAGREGWTGQSLRMQTMLALLLLPAVHALFIYRITENSTVTHAPVSYYRYEVERCYREDEGSIKVTTGTNATNFIMNSFKTTDCEETKWSFDIRVGDSWKLDMDLPMIGGVTHRDPTVFCEMQQEMVTEYFTGECAQRGTQTHRMAVQEINGTQHFVIQIFDSSDCSGKPTLHPVTYPCGRCVDHYYTYCYH